MGIGAILNSRWYKFTVNNIAQKLYRSPDVMWWDSGLPPKLNHFLLKILGYLVKKGKTQD